MTKDHKDGDPFLVNTLSAALRESNCVAPEEIEHQLGVNHTRWARFGTGHVETVDAGRG